MCGVVVGFLRGVLVVCSRCDSGVLVVCLFSWRARVRGVLVFRDVLVLVTCSCCARACGVIAVCSWCDSERCARSTLVFVVCNLIIQCF